MDTISKEENIRKKNEKKGTYLEGKAHFIERMDRERPAKEMEQ